MATMKFLVCAAFLGNVFIASANLHLSETTDTVVVDSGRVRVEVSKSIWRMRVIDKSTDTVLLDTATDPTASSLGYGKWVGEYFDIYQGYLWRTGRVDQWYFATSVTSVAQQSNDVYIRAATNDPHNTTLVLHLYDLRDAQISFELRVDPPLDNNRISFSTKRLGQKFFGFGERFNSVQQDSENVGCWTEDGSWDIGKLFPDIRFPGGPTSTYVPMPLYLSTLGYGFQINTFYRSEFNLKADYDAMIVTTETTSMAVTLFVGGTPQASLRMMTDYNGRSLIPPAWEFGPWNQLGTEVSGVNDTERARQLLLEQDIPVSVYIESLHFLPRGDDRGHHQQLLARNKDMLSMGLPTLAYFNPMVAVDWNDTWNYGKTHGYFTRNSSGLPYQFYYIAASLFHMSQVDFTNPEAVTWYQGLLKTAVGLGYKGWMYDYGEYTPPDSINFLNQTGLRSHNEYPLLYQKACHDLLTQSLPTQPGHAPDFLFYHRYAGSGLRAQLRASLSIGVSGIPFSGSDIGGFEWFTGKSADEELWVRWTQLGAFSGLMHEQGGGKGLGPKTHIFDWKNGTRLWRKFAKLRTQLFPYVFTQAFLAREVGLPVMRHHILDFPDDEVAILLDSQYMFGPDLLVAPVLEPGETRCTVYLPSLVSWLDVSSTLAYDESDGRFRIGFSERQKGGSIVQVECPLDTIPLFVRSGSVLFVLDPSVMTLAPAPDPRVISLDEVKTLHVWVWPGEDMNASGQDWAGNSLNVTKGANSSSDGFTVDFRFVQRYTKAVLQIAANFTVAVPTDVKSSSVAYQRAKSWQDVAMGNQTRLWYLDGSQGTLWAAVLPTDGSIAVSVR